MASNTALPKRPRCFVVIGFGIKTDLATGRAINLDKTYEELIKPALEAAGIEGFRAIDINRSGTIDSIMYKWLFDAELVVADITTLNANVLYEVGVRHALKPSTTIMIGESTLLKSLPFDISHTIVHPYFLDGETLKEEAKPAFRAKLAGLLLDASKEPQQDSPVYDFMPGMAAPQRKLSEEPREDEAADLPLAAILSLALMFRNKGDLEKAGTWYRTALERCPNDLFLQQQLASVLSQKAAEQPDEDKARRDLAEAEAAMAPSDPATSTDPLVLCITGEIARRKYEKTRDPHSLHMAAWHLTRAFYIKQDPQQGIECAKLHAESAVREKRPKKDHPAVQSAFAACAAVAALCLKQTSAPGFDSRDDRVDVSTSLAQAYLGMGKFEQARALLPAIHPTLERGPAWDSFLAQNPTLAQIGRTYRSPFRVPLLWAAGGAAAASLLFVVLTNDWTPSITPNDQISRKSPASSETASKTNSETTNKQVFAPETPTPAHQPAPGPEIAERPSPPASNEELRSIIVPLMSSLNRTETKLDLMARAVAETREGSTRIYSFPSRLDSLEEKLTKSLATQNSILEALERNSRMASGCSENTTAILRLANLLIDQTRKINNELQQPSRTVRTSPPPGGPHIQFDALRPGLAEGFAYPLENGENPIRELGLSLSLNSTAAGGPAIVVREHRTGKKTELVRSDLNTPAQPQSARDRQPQQVRFRGFEIGEYCSLLTLNRDPRAPRWLGVIRLREGCGESCASGCGAN